MQLQRWPYIDGIRYPGAPLGTLLVEREGAQGLWMKGGGPHLCTAGELDGQLGGAEHMLWLGPLWQDIARSHPPDERPLPGLADTEVPSIEHSKAYLHWLPPCDQMCPDCEYCT